MKKSSFLKDGFVTPRNLFAVALCLTGMSLAMLSFGDPTPSSDTLTPTHLSVTYTDGPLAPNPTGVLPPPVCAGANTCSDFTVTINASGLAATHNFTWSVQWPVPNVDMDIFVEDTNGNLVANNNSTTDPSAITLPIPPQGTVYHLVVASSVGTSIITGTASLEPKYPTAQQGAGAPPRYMHYRAGNGQGDGANEPSIGIDWNPNMSGLQHEQVNTGGVAFFTVGSSDYRVNFDDCSSPAVNVWDDVSAPFTVTFPLSDPIGFVDHFSTAQLGLSSNPPHTPGRVFSLDLIGGQGDSFGSFSDNDGNSWLNGGNGGAPAGPDHETLGGGPFHAPIPTSPAYPNVIYYCSQNGAQNAECSASYDGGLTFGPGVPLFNPTVCGGGIHGHVKVSPQGTAYVPNSSCAAGSPLGANGVGRSTDNGLTWNEFNVPGSTGSQDPAIGIGQNNVGKPVGQVPNTIYLGWISADNHAHIAHSPDEGATWQNDIDVSSIFGIQKAVFPIVVAGDDNRASYAFLGTYPAITNKQVWHLYVATTYDGGHSWILTDTTPDDPVQVGDVCLLGLSCTSANRNLLDFNGIDVDKLGRVLIAYTDGCPNCQNVNTISQSSSAHAVVARQSGGRRLFSAFDPQEPTAPAAPQVLSAVRQSSPAGVAVTWLTPDNGGSPITGYNIYRGTASGAETLLPNMPVPVTNKYLDQTADSSTNYFYRVTAVNAITEGPFCREVSINGTGGAATACAPPFIQVQGAAAATNDPTGQFSIQNVNFGEPYIDCNTKQLTAVMKVNTMDPGNAGTPVTPPVSTWQVYFRIPGSANSTGQPQTLFLEYDNTTLPEGEFLAGWVDPATGADCSALFLPNDPANPVSGTVAPDGTITMNLKLTNPVTFGTCAATGGSDMTVSPNQWTPGLQITNIQGKTYQRAGGIITGAKLTKAQTPGDGTYTTIGNVAGCNSLTPIAILSATPMTGPTSTNFTFDGTASFEPLGACGVINSYTLDFGDGTTPQTNGTGMFSHTYSATGNYPARLTVHDSIGHASTNVAQVVIAVTSSQIQLTGVVSRKIHGPAGPFDIVLTPNSPPSVECRAPGATGTAGVDYQLIFVFPSALTSVGSVSAPGVTTAAGQIDPNDSTHYIVNLTGVPNAHYTTVTLNNVHAGSNTGNVSATFGLLIGDVTANRVVTNTDVGAVKAQVDPTTHVTQSNFRMDVSGNGFVTNTDVGTVKTQVNPTGGLPSPP